MRPLYPTDHRGNRHPTTPPGLRAVGGNLAGSMPGTRRWHALVLVLAFAQVALAACTSGTRSDDPTSTPSTTAPDTTSSPSPLVPPALDVRIADARGAGAAGEIAPDPLAAASEEVGTTLATMFTIGFIDRDAWEDGAYTSLFRLFEADVRDRAHQDLELLSLGPLAEVVDGVRVPVASAELRFLANAAGRPVVAIADTQFVATARAGDARAELAQTARFVLRWSEGAWRIAGYDVAARIPSAIHRQPSRSDAAFAPGLPATDPTFLLAIGSDARPDQAVATARADSLHVIGIDPRTGIVSILGIPRDTWTPIPGHRPDKINASLTLGGPELVVQTVERLTGIEIDAYALTGFAGFTQAISTIHGIDIRIPYAIDDRYAHARFRPGPAHLGGKQALAFARARHDLKDGDFERSLNQGRLLVAMAQTLARSAREETGPFVRWALAGSGAIRTDLALEDLFEMLVAVPMFDPDAMRNAVTPGRVATVGSKSVVLLDARATAMFRDLARDGVLDG
jgi:LCP family protein required for cell wall assembly